MERGGKFLTATGDGQKFTDRYHVWTPRDKF